MQMKKLVVAFIGVAAVLALGSALAGTVPSGGIALSKINTNVGTTVSFLANVLSKVSIVSGIGFVMASFFKFHQHKMQPTQTPLSQGITLVLIGAGLLVFPTLLPTTTTAIFGSAAKVNQINGGQINGLIGTGTGM